MLRRVYEISFEDDKGNNCSLITEGEEMTRALVHNGYRITVQDTVVQSDRLDDIHNRLEKMEEEQNMAAERKRKIAHDSNLVRHGMISPRNIPDAVEDTEERSSQDMMPRAGVDPSGY